MRFEIGNTYGKGLIPWNKGRINTLTDDVRKRMSESAKKRNPLGRKGPKGKSWSKSRIDAQRLVKFNKPIRTKPIIKNGREYSPLWHEIRRLVHKRDDYTCQECGVLCKNNILINTHHIDYDIKNNELSNLITLCVGCHAKTNYKRVDWIIHFGGKTKVL